MTNGDDIDEHEAVQALLPWHATGRLDETDQARVRAHLFECAACRAEAAEEAELADRVATMPLDIELGWQAMRARIGAHDTAATVVPMRQRRWRTAGWLITAQAAVLLFAVLIFQPGQRIGAYHALGAARTIPATGNVIATFRPDASAQAISDALAASDARIVDGPTEAGTFVLHVAADRRSDAITKLHARAAVTMAEPIDL